VDQQQTKIEEMEELSQHEAGRYFYLLRLCGLSSFTTVEIMEESMTETGGGLDPTWAIFFGCFLMIRVCQIARQEREELKEDIEVRKDN
jgi:hypothetical protein